MVSINVTPLGDATIATQAQPEQVEVEQATVEVEPEAEQQVESIEAQVLEVEVKPEQVQQVQQEPEEPQQAIAELSDDSSSESESSSSESDSESSSDSEDERRKRKKRKKLRKSKKLKRRKKRKSDWLCGDPDDIEGLDISALLPIAGLLALKYFTSKWIRIRTHVISNNCLSTILPPSIASTTRIVSFIPSSSSDCR